MCAISEQAEIVRRAGYRVTQSRLAVLQVLAENDQVLDPAAIYQLGQRIHPRLGRVSVYRALDLLVGLGLVRHVHGEGGCHGFARAAREEGHYLVCQSCGQVQEFPCGGLDGLLETVGREYGFHIQQHLLQLSGLCSACQA